MQFRLNSPFDKFSIVFPFISEHIKEPEINECIQWFWRLGRYAKNQDIMSECLPPVVQQIKNNTAHQEFWRRTNISERLWITFTEHALRGWFDAEFPASALSEVTRAVIWFEQNIESLPVPPCFSRSTTNYGRLWFAVQLLGNNGRNFLFARNAVSRAFNAEDPTIKINPKTVHAFIKLAVQNGLIYRTRQGCSLNPKFRQQTGKPGADKFKLCHEINSHTLFELAGKKKMRKEWESYILNHSSWIADGYQR